ncbi:MAG: hypothetical protein M3R13_01445 [Armatimonadota bacterium]|nr:hypothetical protein [Armatimonadota bacterium]
MRWVLLASVTTVFLLIGCSGLSVLMIRNLSGEALSVAIESNEPHHGEGDERQVASGEEVETIRWHSRAPSWIEVTVKDTEGVVSQKKWLREHYPRMMQDGSGLATYYVLEIGRDRMVLRDPTTWDAIRRNPLGYGVLLMWPVGVILGMTLVARRWLRGRRHASQL